jgi:hypothetical protein
MKTGKSQAGNRTLNGCNAVIDKTLENMKHIWIISRICDKIEIENRQMGG